MFREPSYDVPFRSEVSSISNSKCNSTILPLETSSRLIKQKSEQPAISRLSFQQDALPDSFFSNFLQTDVNDQAYFTSDASCPKTLEAFAGEESSKSHSWDKANYLNGPSDFSIWKRNVSSPTEVALAGELSAWSTNDGSSTFSSNHLLRVNNLVKRPPDKATHNESSAFHTEPDFFGADDLGANYFSLNFSTSTMMPEPFKMTPPTSVDGASTSSSAGHFPYDQKWSLGHNKNTLEMDEMQCWNVNSAPLSLHSQYSKSPNNSESFQFSSALTGQVDVPKVRRCKPFAVAKKSDNTSAKNHLTNELDTRRQNSADSTSFPERFDPSFLAFLSKPDDSAKSSATVPGSFAATSQSFEFVHPKSSTNVGANNDGFRFAMNPGATNEVYQDSQLATYSGSMSSECKIGNSKIAARSADDLLPAMSHCKVSCPNFFMSSPDCARCKFYNLSQPEEAVLSVPGDNQSKDADVVKSSAIVNLADLIPTPGVTILGIASGDANCSFQAKSAPVSVQCSEIEQCLRPETSGAENDTQEKSKCLESISVDGNLESKQTEKAEEKKCVEKVSSETQEGTLETGASVTRVKYQYDKDQLIELGKSHLSIQVPQVDAAYKNWFNLVFVKSTQLQSSNSEAVDQELLAFKVCERPFATMPANQKRVCLNPMFQRALKQAVADK